MKPELLVKEDNNELKCELQRKEELLRRHYDKISQWQNLLADLQVSGTLTFIYRNPAAIFKVAQDETEMCGLT